MKRALIQQAKQHSEDNHSNRFRNSITKHMHALHKSGSASSIGSGTGGSSSSSSATAREVNHGPTPLSHSKDHQDHKGYIDSVIRSLLYDEHRGGDELIRQIIQDVEANINPRDWSLCRTRHPNHYHNNNNARGSMSDVEMHTTSAAMEYHQGVSARRGEWTLESIKLAYPEASRRVALSIISNAAEGVTFDTFRYDSKAIWITKLLNHWQYHYAMIFIALFHCIMGFVEQSITYDPYASTYHHQSFCFVVCLWVTTDPGSSLSLVAFYLPTGTEYLNPYVTLTIEVIIVVCYCVDCFLRIQTARPPFFHNHGWLMLKIILSVVFFVDIFLGYLYIGPVNISYYDGRNLTMANIAIQSGISINATVTHVNPNFISLPQILTLPVATSFRLSRFLRPLLFIESANDLRKEVLSIGHVIHSLLPVLFLILVWIFLFSMLGVIFFPRKELAAMAKVNPTMGDLYFTDLYHGMITWMNVFFGAVIWPNVSVWLFW